MGDQLWVVRAGEQARYVDEFESGGYIAVGFREVARDDLSTVRADGLRSRATNPTLRTLAGQLSKFAFDVDVDDLVIVPRLPKRRDYLVGRVVSGYRHVDPDPPSGHHQRSVQWLGTFDRDALSKDAVNTLGAIQTIFRPTKVEAELRTLLTDLQPFAGVGGRSDTSASPGPVANSRAADPIAASAGAVASPVQLDVHLDGHGRASVTCDHPALVMEQVPRHLDPSGGWGGVPGIYVLTGTELEIASTRTGIERTLTTTMIVRPWAYVGLSEDFLGRLGSHRQSKPEWRRALLIRSGASPFSSDDIKYLERSVHEVLSATGDVRLDQATPRGNLSARPKNLPLLDACAHAVVAVLRLTGTLI